MKRANVNYREVLVKRLAVLKSCYILDAGTGAGAMTKVLSDHLNVSIVSVDDRRVFPYVYEKVDGKKVEFVACDFANLPFEEGAFCCNVCDLVISTSEDWQRIPILKEFKRVLRTKFSLYVTDYYPEKVSRSKEEMLASETWKLYKMFQKPREKSVSATFRQT